MSKTINIEHDELVKILSKHYGVRGGTVVGQIAGLGPGLLPKLERVVMFHHKKVVVKDPVDLMKALVDGGWVVTEEGTWIQHNKPPFYPYMWDECGKEADAYNYDPSWILTEI